jgi:hypothetical protein
MPVVPGSSSAAALFLLLAINMWVIHRIGWIRAAEHHRAAADLAARAALLGVLEGRRR